MLKKISKVEFEELCVGAQVIERDPFGPKVWLLSEGRILKVFRRKRLISSQLWTSYASRFAKNAKKLALKGIPSVQIESSFRIPEIERQGVIYPMLPGDTLRDWIAKGTEEDLLLKMDKLGNFIAKLHHEGVLFRALHMANILVLDNGELGLIDIDDMTFRPWGPLTECQRIRNFHHMDRYDADRIALSNEGGKRFIDSYIGTAGLSPSSSTILKNSFRSIFDKHTVSN